MSTQTTHATKVAHIFFPSRYARHFFAFSRGKKVQEDLLARGVCYHDSVLQMTEDITYGNQVLEADGHKPCCEGGTIMVRLFYASGCRGEGEGLTALAGELDRSFEAWLAENKIVVVEDQPVVQN